MALEKEKDKGRREKREGILGFWGERRGEAKMGQEKVLEYEAWLFVWRLTLSERRERERWGVGKEWDMSCMCAPRFRFPPA